MALKKIGGLWLREGKNGKFMGGVVEPEGREGKKINVMIFKNNKKEPGSKHPDYEIFVSDDEKPPVQQATEEFF